MDLNEKVAALESRLRKLEDLDLDKRVHDLENKAKGLASEEVQQAARRGFSGADIPE